MPYARMRTYALPTRKCAFAGQLPYIYIYIYICIPQRRSPPGACFWDPAAPASIGARASMPRRNCEITPLLIISTSPSHQQTKHPLGIYMHEVGTFGLAADRQGNIHAAGLLLPRRSGTHARAQVPAAVCSNSANVNAYVVICYIWLGGELFSNIQFSGPGPGQWQVRSVRAGLREFFIASMVAYRSWVPLAQFGFML